MNVAQRQVAANLWTCIHDSTKHSIGQRRVGWWACVEIGGVFDDNEIIVTRVTDMAWQDTG